MIYDAYNLDDAMRLLGEHWNPPCSVLCYCGHQQKLCSTSAEIQAFYQQHEELRNEPT